MKIGYQYAIETLLNRYRQSEDVSQEQRQQLKEGIEYLCLPWREDLAEDVPSPLFEKDDPPFIEDNSEIARRGEIQIRMSRYVWEVLKEIGSVV